MKTRDKIIELYYIHGILEKIQNDLLEELDKAEDDMSAVDIGKHINDLTTITNVLGDNLAFYGEEFNITQKQVDKFKFKASNSYNILQQTYGFKIMQELIDLNNKYTKDIRVELEKKLHKKGQYIIPKDVQLDGTYKE